jgi:hypothetical protein
MKRRQAMSVRFPPEVLEEARGVLSPGESLNELVVGVVEREVRRRKGLAALAEIDRVRERVRARVGVQPSSVPLIRALREGKERRA